MGRSRKHRTSAVIPKIDRPPDRVEVLSSKRTFSIAEALVWITLAVLLAFSLATLVYPVARALYRFEINVTEGWNVYNAQAAMQHRYLYSTKHGWNDCGYPFLSFYLIGYLSRFIRDYLFAGRLLSLVGFLLSCVLVGLIVKKLTGAWAPAVFAGVFSVGLFCSHMPSYVGMDDPQMLGHAFLLLGLWLYLLAPPSTMRIAGVASLFILGGNIKHNLLPAPISVLSDLFTTSLSKAVRFILFGIFFLALSIAVNMLVGGPFFISNVLAPQPYSLGKLRDTSLGFYSSLGLPLAISVFWSIWQFQNRQARVIAFYFFSSLLIDAALGGGAGVNTNTFFDNLFAMAIIMGACLDALWKAPILSLGKGGRWRFLVPILLYSTVAMTFVPLAFHVPRMLSELPLRQKLFRAEVSFLAAQPGPAVCESLIRCYYAGKERVLYSFGIASLARLGKLNSNELVNQIAEKKYGAIQTYIPVTERPYDPPEMGEGNSFPDDVLDAIRRNYVEALKGPDCHIYVPRVEPTGSSTPH
jgi:hypothetical protein